MTIKERIARLENLQTLLEKAKDCKKFLEEEDENGNRIPPKPDESSWRNEYDSYVAWDTIISDLGKLAER